MIIYGFHVETWRRNHVWAQKRRFSREVIESAETCVKTKDLCTKMRVKLAKFVAKGSAPQKQKLIPFKIHVVAQSFACASRKIFCFTIKRWIRLRFQIQVRTEKKTFMFCCESRKI